MRAREIVEQIKVTRERRLKAELKVTLDYFEKKLSYGLSMPSQYLGRSQRPSNQSGTTSVSVLGAENGDATSRGASSSRRSR